MALGGVGYGGDFGRKPNSQFGAGPGPSRASREHAVLSRCAFVTRTLNPRPRPILRELKSGETGDGALAMTPRRRAGNAENLEAACGSFLLREHDVRGR